MARDVHDGLIASSALRKIRDEGSCVEESQRALPNRQLAKEKLEFRQFEHVRHLLPFRTLADKLDWVAVNPLVPHSVMENGAHQISNLRSRCFRPLDAVQPFFNGDRLYLIESAISPTRENPDLQIAFIRGSRRERFASLILTDQLFELVMSDQFGKRARSAFRMQIGRASSRE